MKLLDSNKPVSGITGAVQTEARKFILPRLRKMADGLEQVGDNPFSMSLSGKGGYSGNFSGSKLHAIG